MPGRTVNYIYLYTLWYMIILAHIYTWYIPVLCLRSPPCDLRKSRRFAWKDFMIVVLAVGVATLGALRAPTLPRTSPFPNTAESASTVSAPGTTALVSPPGFEHAYEALRDYRTTTGRTLMRLEQLAQHEPDLASQLGRRVNFVVPTTARGALTTFFAHPTAQFIISALICTTCTRLQFGALSPVDAMVALATAAFWCVQEHFIHDALLHSEQQWFGSMVHRWHHELPYYHVSLDGIGLALAWFGAVAIALVSLGFALGGGSALAYCLTSLGTYTLFGGLYEASHYLAHTKVPLPRPLARVRSHHMKHHTVDDQYWLAFTLPVVDDLFGTNPSVRDLIAARWRGKRAA